MTTAIAKADGTEARGAFIMRDALTHETEQRSLLGEYVTHHMVDGTDFGTIPGTKNKTLLKPGAEKLTQLFRCVPRYTLEDKIENWDTGLFHYRFSCSIVTQADGTVVAEGVGSCSTFEDKYRWRQSERVCPHCGKVAIIKGKAEYGGGWLCFEKKGGCKAKFADGDAAIEGQKTGRVQNPDILNTVNTVLKMAKKRALVDAAIALARCSDIFTQDVEDFPESQPSQPARTISKDEFGAMLARKGKTWGNALSDWDAAKGTTYVADKTPFERVKPEHVASYYNWLEKQPDAAPKPAPTPAPDATAPDQQGRTEAVDALNQALAQIGMDYVSAALLHGKAFGWSNANKPPALAELTPAAIWKLVDEIVK